MAVKITEADIDYLSESYVSAAYSYLRQCGWGRNENGALVRPETATPRQDATFAAMEAARSACSGFVPSLPPPADERTRITLLTDLAALTGEEDDDTSLRLWRELPPYTYVSLAD